MRWPAGLQALVAGRLSDNPPLHPFSTFRFSAMSLRPHLLRTLFSFLLALSAGLAPAQSAFAEPQPLDRIIVVVNDGTVLQSELEQAMDDARAQIAKRKPRSEERRVGKA